VESNVGLDKINYYHGDQSLACGIVNSVIPLPASGCHSRNTNLTVCVRELLCVRSTVEAAVE
jgi:hypothetical protein